MVHLKEKRERILKDSGFGVVKGDLMAIYYFYLTARTRFLCYILIYLLVCFSFSSTEFTKNP